MISIDEAVAAIPSQYHRIYSRCKLATDPLYGAVARELTQAPIPELPLLDLGCGMGLLALYLRSDGFRPLITGIDYDDRKIRLGRRAIESLGLGETSLAHGDARGELPPHSGHVTILDILQFLSPAEQAALLEDAAARVAPGGRLVIRSGLASDGRRFRTTRALDHLARLVRWMKDAPRHYPTQLFLEKALGAAGLEVNCQPLWGRTPFHNFLITATRPETSPQTSPDQER